MKKIAYFFFVLIAAIGLTACSGKNEPSAKPDKPGSGSIDQKKVYQNEVFKDVMVKKTGDKIVVTGKAQVFEGVFQYKLNDGDKVLLEDHYQTAGAPAWGDFEISIENALLEGGNDVQLELFVYSAKDGSKINVLEIPMK